VDSGHLGHQLKALDRSLTLLARVSVIGLKNLDLEQSEAVSGDRGIMYECWPDSDLQRTCVSFAVHQLAQDIYQLSLENRGVPRRNMTEDTRPRL
jgi:hypothetical protein